MKTFLNTNVLAYAVDPRDPAKRARARQCMTEVEAITTVVISTQVMLEFHSVLTWKLRCGG
jgi:predicted nucleic acid-binding protein